MQLAMPNRQIFKFEWKNWSVFRVLCLSTVIFSFTSIAHESNYVTATSFLFGDTATQVGILLGSVFMGYAFGAWFSQHIPEKHLVESFLLNELVLTIVAGFSIVFAFWAYANVQDSALAIRAVIILVSLLVGMEDALLMRYAILHTGDTKNIGAILYWGYLGSAVAGFLFGTVFLRLFGGVMNVALILGLVDGLVVCLNVLYFRRQTPRWPLYLIISLISVGALFFAYTQNDSLSRNLTNPLYEDTIVEQWNSIYANIVLTQHRDEHQLFINGGLQFSSFDEEQYHEPLVIPAMELASDRNPNRDLVVAIAGGGDGLAAREVLTFSNVAEVVVIDLDHVMTDVVAMSEPVVTYNDHAFEDPRVTILNQNAYSYLQNTNQLFDVIIVDLVDPNNEQIGKLYAQEFYTFAAQALSFGGIFVTQSTSPWYAPEAFWTINLTIDEVFETVIPYRWSVPSFGDWGWNIASNVAFSADDISINEAQTNWLTQQGWESFQFFGQPEWQTRERLEAAHSINSMSSPILVHLYNSSTRWDRWGEQ